MKNQRLASFPAGGATFLTASSAAIAALAVFVQLWLVDRASIPMDEGELADTASRLLAGDVLYADIHVGIAPGIYHVVAALFAVFGENLLVTRWAQVFVNAAIAICLWLLAVRVVRWHWAALPPAIYLLLVAVAFPVLTMLNYSSLALALALAALLFLQRYLESGRTAEGVVLGLLLAAAALTKQNYGALALLATAILLVWNRSSSALAGRSMMSAFLPVVAAGGALALAVVVYFTARGAFADFLFSTLIQLRGPQLASFNNPIPPLFGPHPSSEARFVFLYTPPTLFNHILHGGKLFDQPVSTFTRELSIRLSYGIPLASIAVAPVVLWLTRRRTDSRKRGESRSIALFAGLFFLGIFPSAIWSHLAFVIAPTLLLLALLFDRCEDLLRERAEWVPRLSLAAALLVAVASLFAAVRVGGAVRSWFPEPLGSSRASLYLKDDQAALYRGAVRFLQACAAEGEPVFVAPDIPILYFLSERRNPTPYGLLIPGSMDAQVVIDRLEASRTSCIVYNPRMYPEFPPFEELFPDVSRYLQETYRVSETIQGVRSEWHGLVRRSDAGS